MVNNCHGFCVECLECGKCHLICFELAHLHLVAELCVHVLQLLVTGQINYAPVSFGCMRLFVCLHAQCNLDILCVCVHALIIASSPAPSPHPPQLMYLYSIIL